jgi:hypothetical protein
MTEAQRLNKWLETQGKSIDGHVLYRLIWSDKVYEHRHGLYRDFTESGLFLREVKETRLVRKYNYINERWILEKWAPGNLTAHKELPDALGGDYIPVYVFEDKKGNYLPPTEKVLQLILDFMGGKIRKPDEESQEAIEEKEIAYQMEEIGNHPDFSTFGDSRNAVGYTKGLKNVP